MDAIFAMRRAIAVAEVGLAAGQSPFGCCIVRDGQVLAEEHNRVLLGPDATAHAEINAIRAACRRVNDVHLAGSVLYSTCEPCPMCLAACHWARVDAVVFGATIADAQQAGFNELTIAADQMIREGRSPLRLTGGLLAEECRALFQRFVANPRHRTY